ncbi:hypothetical protein GIB67_016540 [Kingdonia uniflora]|uniref:RNase H type-1 domain-containing protein n=1 Tax=Kingdonia uniflora TaxID=39325 RepID=A0A7J7NQP5_9MAGN|nr:hypothetical protein GIB67_016540 [Kingdonia uniflora]
MLNIYVYNIKICRESKDHRIWKPDLHGKFSARSAFNEIKSKEQKVWWDNYLNRRAIHPEQPYGDGASKGNPGRGSLGFIIRGFDGKVLWTGAMGLGVTTSFFAECRAIIQGVECAASNGCLVAWVESDCTALHCTAAVLAFCTGKIPWMMKAEWEEASYKMQHVRFSATWREVNFSSDLIAGKGTRIQRGSEGNIFIWLILPIVGSSADDHVHNTIALIVLLQYIPRLFIIFPLNRRIIKNTGVVAKTAWAGAAYNLILYMLASHVASNASVAFASTSIASNVSVAFASASVASDYLETDL